MCIERASCAFGVQSVCKTFANPPKTEDLSQISTVSPTILKKDEPRSPVGRPGFWCLGIRPSEFGGYSKRLGMLVRALHHPMPDELDMADGGAAGEDVAV